MPRSQASAGDPSPRGAERRHILTAPLAFFVLALAAMCLARVGLVAWQYQRVDAAGGLWRVLVSGCRMDLLTVSYLLLPATLFSLIFAGDHRVGRVFGPLLRVYLTLMFGYLLFMEASTPAFIQEYDSRPNRLFIEYLVHPREVGTMLWRGHKPAVFTGIFASAAALFVGWRIFGALTRRPRATSFLRRLALASSLPLLFLGARSSLGHRAATPSSVAFSSDHLVNDLCLNSGYAVLYAAYGLKNDANAADVYGELPEDVILGEVRAQMLGVEPGDFVVGGTPTAHEQRATRAIRNPAARPKNLVIILEESLGAQYVGALGGSPVTQVLDELRDQGWWFENLYATGTRSARGLEAVVSGFPPSPARSVVKLGKSQRDFFTLAGYLGQQGFATQFIYGGDAQFDNMRAFFLSNGFDEIIDLDDYEDPIFEGSWGVCDEDIFAKAHASFLDRDPEVPFFSLVFSVTNHSPFEYPEGRIELYDQPAATVANAVRYADHALGQFLEQARSAPYWKDTIFLVVADHDSRVFGAELVPVRHFHVPGVILGEGVEPRIDARVASQIDLAPTLLSLMGVSGVHPMIGRDLTRVAADETGRALMQYGQNNAYMEGERVVVLQPELEPRQFRYLERELVPEDLDPELARRALAHVLLPSWLYRDLLYRPAPPSE